LGLSLGRSANLAGSFKGQAEHDPATPRDAAMDQSLAVTDKISRKYAEHVKEAEQKRLERLAPLNLPGSVPPDERELMKSMKGELDVVLSKVGMEPGAEHLPHGWDALEKNSDFQKTIQHLAQHGRTGEFIEQYGRDGRYEGKFLHGMRYGQGVHEFRGEVYEGEWKWDNRHGYGTLTMKDGSKVKGQWSKGKPHGLVTITDAQDNIVYEGEFQNGKRHGLGRQVFENGEKYDGGWKDGRLHDRGVYHFSNGDKLYGMWSDGLYDGIGVFHYTDGSISRRVYKKGLLMSVQDYEGTSQRFGRTLTRQGMQRHTGDKEFPREVFLLRNS